MTGPPRYSDEQNRAMDAAMLELSPAQACRRAAAGQLRDPDTGQLVPAFPYNVQTAAVRKRRNARRREAADRAELPALAQLAGAAEVLAGIAHEHAAKLQRKHRAGKLTADELAAGARALRETHRAVLPLLRPSSSSESEPAGDGDAPEPSSPADPTLAQWAADAAES